MPNTQGGCLCGAIRYQLKDEPTMALVCHCKTCQKNSGTAFSTNLAMPEASVKIEGDCLTTFAEHASATAPPFFRSFCSRCGSPICARGEAYPGVIFIKAGTLDDTSRVDPGVQLWCSEKQPWLTFSDGPRQLPSGFGSERESTPQ
jgi:hypothetical protein